LDRRRAITQAKHRRRRTTLLAGIAVSAGVAGSWWVATGPLLGLTHVEISGYTQPDQARVMRTIQIAARKGTMLRLPTVAVRDALIRHPWVASVEVHHNWPRGIDVTIVQAKPVAVALASDGRRLLISDGGRVLGEDAEGADLPRFRMPPARPGDWLRGQAQRAPFEFLTAMNPDVARSVTDLRLEGGVVTARLVDGPELRLGPPRMMWAKGRALEAVVENTELETPLAKAEYLDLSAPAQPTLGGFPAGESGVDGAIEGSTERQPST
jgi:cell division septal protein FtsQ